MFEARAGIRIAVLVACWIVLAVSGILSFDTTQGMVAEVNAHLPEEKKFSLLGWYYGKYRRLLSEYRRLYPSGTRILRLRRLDRVMFLAFVVGAVALGFPWAGILWVGGGMIVLRWILDRNGAA